MASSKVAVLAALVGNFLIAVAKLVGGFISGSAAMFAEAAHSFSDVGNQVLLLVGIRKAESPPTERHPFGGGKSAYFWPFLVAVLLFGFAGGYSVFEGIEKVRHPHEVEDITVALIVLALAFLIELGSLGVAVREARHGAKALGARSAREFVQLNRDASLLTVLVEDALALVGLPIAAAALVLAKTTGNGVWDGVGSILIGALLMGFALFLAREVHDLLIGRGLRAQDVERMKAVLARHPEVLGFEDMRSMHLGPSTAFVGAEVVLRPGLKGEDAIRALARLEKELTEAVPVLKYIYLEPKEAPAPDAAST